MNFFLVRTVPLMGKDNVTTKMLMQLKSYLNLVQIRNPLDLE